MNIGLASEMLRYVVTETSQHTSLDPLDADQTQNLSVARMLYATPIEIEDDNTISSLVLESFKYDAKNQLIEWVTKSNIKYSDGTGITPEDVAFSVARMAYARPHFPVIEYIEGLREWTSQTNALETFPAGIKVQGNKITIKLSKKLEHPLFRFCLELFSVIPRKCVDAKTNKIVCDKLPSSGRYEIATKTDKEIEFKERAFSIIAMNGTNKMVFEYVQAVNLTERMKTLDARTIVSGNEIMYSFDEIENFRSQSAFGLLPAARFSVVQLNPNIGVFKDRLCRQVFADQFRKEYQKISANFSLPESSIFTKLLPGYMKSKELEEKAFSKISKLDRNICIKKISLEPFMWGYVENEKNSALVTTFKATLKTFSVKNSNPVIVKSRKELADAFVDGKISALGAGSGFWAFDPSGDLQMLFTPNLHKPLNFVTTDQSLQKLIRDVTENPENGKKYKLVNQYLHDEAMFNVYSHVRRFYFSKNKGLLNQARMAITSPAPWQVFKL